MAIAALIKGNPEDPLLVCVPGMMGVPENFLAMAAPWMDRFCSVFLDLHPQNRESGLGDSDRSLSTVNYDDTSMEIRDFLLERFPGRKYYFLGISLGGKIIFDFATRFPELYAGGVVTDVGLGPFNESALYQFSFNIIPTINLEQPWSGIRRELREKVSVNTIRVFIQTQVDYSPEEQRGRWKDAIIGIQGFLDRQRIGDLWQNVGLLPVTTTVLKAEGLSGISDADLERMKTMPDKFKIVMVPGAAHFIHVTHQEYVQRAVIALLEGNPTSGASRHPQKTEAGSAHPHPYQAAESDGGASTSPSARTA